MVITEVACGINCTYSTALFNKYGLDCTAAEHTLGIAGFQGTQSETQKLPLLAAFSSQRNKQCKSKVLILIFLLWNVCYYCLPPPLSFVSEMKENTGKLSKPLVIIIMETKQRIRC